MRPQNGAPIPAVEKTSQRLRDRPDGKAFPYDREAFQDTRENPGRRTSVCELRLDGLQRDLLFLAGIGFAFAARSSHDRSCVLAHK